MTLALAGAAADGVGVYVGADRPLVRPALTAAAVHGDSGLPAEGLPDPVRPRRPGTPWISSSARCAPCRAR